MKNFKVKDKFRVTFTFILVLFMINVIAIIVSLHIVANSFITFYNGPYRSTYRAEKMCREMESVQKNLALSLLFKSEVEEHMSECEKNVAMLSEDIDVLSDTFKENQSLLDELTNVLSSASVQLDTIRDLVDKKDWEQGASYFESTLSVTLDHAYELLDEINNTADKNASDFFTTAMSTKVSASVVSILLSLINLSLTILAAVRLTKFLTLPVYEIEKAAGKIVEGDLEARVSYQSGDEIGELADTTRKMIHMFRRYIRELSDVLAKISQGDFNVKIDREFLGEFAELKSSVETITLSISETLRKIKSTADQVAEGSDQVSKSAQELSCGACDQSEEVEKLVESISEISDKIKVNAHHSEEAQTKASEVGEQMSRSGEQMQQLTEAMSDIRTSSEEISEIIGIISGIAAQTNMLALNAAVEAARAGETGKGFAVLAVEVRNLAGEVVQASKNTSNLIVRSVQAVEQGTKIAHEAKEMLLSAANGAADVKNALTTISEASRDQSVFVSNIQNNIEEISGIVKTNMAAAEQSAAASEHLSEQAHSLYDLVSGFTLQGQL